MTTYTNKYISVKLLCAFLHLHYKPPGVDFIKVGRKAQIIEIALSKLWARRKARRTPVKSFSKVGRRAQIGRKNFMKSTPGSYEMQSLVTIRESQKSGFSIFEGSWSELRNESAKFYQASKKRKHIHIPYIH